jgi:hypothetical protein
VTESVQSARPFVRVDFSAAFSEDVREMTRTVRHRARHRNATKSSQNCRKHEELTHKCMRSGRPAACNCVRSFVKRSRHACTNAYDREATRTGVHSYEAVEVPEKVSSLNSSGNRGFPSLVVLHQLAALPLCKSRALPRCQHDVTSHVGGPS